MSRKEIKLAVNTAENTIMAFGSIPIPKLVEEQRNLLEKACKQVADLMPTTLNDRQKTVVNRAKEILNYLTVDASAPKLLPSFLPGLSMETVEANAAIVRNDPESGKGRIILIKNWHGSSKSLMRASQRLLEHFVQHQRHISLLLDDCYESLRCLPQNQRKFFMLEMNVFLGNDMPSNFMHLFQNGDASDAAEHIHKKDDRLAVENLRRLFIGKTDKETALFLAQGASVMLEKLALDPKERPQILPGRTLARAGSDEKFFQKIDRIAPSIGAIDDSSLQRIINEYREDLIRDYIVRHTFVFQQANQNMNSGDVLLIIYGGSHMGAGYKGTSFEPIESYLEDKFDITVLEPHKYKECHQSSPVTVHEHMTPQELRDLIVRRNATLHQDRYTFVQHPLQF